MEKRIVSFEDVLSKGKLKFNDHIEIKGRLFVVRKDFVEDVRALPSDILAYRSVEFLTDAYGYSPIEHRNKVCPVCRPKDYDALTGAVVMMFLLAGDKCSGLDFDNFLNRHTMNVPNEDMEYAENRAYAMCVLAEDMKSIYY